MISLAGNRAGIAGAGQTGVRAMDEERWYTVEEITAMLKVHEQTVRRWLRTGDLRGYAFGGKTGYRVKERDLAAFLESRVEGTQGVPRGKGIAA
jgi:excisionase family DNA binding protein